MTIKVKIKVAILILQALVVGACVTSNSNSPVTTGGPSPSPVNSPISTATEKAKPRSEVTLAVLDALLVNDNFVSEVKNKLQITDEQIGELRRASTDQSHTGRGEGDAVQWVRIRVLGQGRRG